MISRLGGRGRESLSSRRSAGSTFLVAYFPGQYAARLDQDHHDQFRCGPTWTRTCRRPPSGRARAHCVSIVIHWTHVYDRLITGEAKPPENRT